MNISITASGSGVAGEMYTVTCAFEPTPVDPATLMWSGPGVDGSNVSQSEGTLTFNPLHTSYGGVYMCQTLIGSSVSSDHEVNWILNVSSKYCKGTC